MENLKKNLIGLAVSCVGFGLFIGLVFHFLFNNKPNVIEPKKPFIIINKQRVLDYSDSSGKYTYYIYSDSNGAKGSFEDLTNKYDVGDTIK